MDYHPYSLRWLGIMAIAGAIAVSAPVFAQNKAKDPTRKLTRTTEPKAPIGQVTAKVRMLGTMKDKSEISSQESGRNVNTNQLTGKASKKLNVPMRKAPTAPLRACVTYNIGGNEYGMVNVTPNGLELIREHEGFDAAYGGTGVGSRYYYNTFADRNGSSIVDCEAYLWDTKNNWQCIGYNQRPLPNILSFSMTSHPVTEQVWGCFYSEDLSKIEIGTLDPMTQARTGVIGSAELPLYAMGFGSDNTLYGIDQEGVLYKISTINGKYTKVAETGLKTDFLTTGTVDSFNDVMYYATCLDNPADNPTEGWALYSIDLKDNYKVEKCWDLTAELGGMYIANDAAQPMAPAAPVLGKVDFIDGSLNGIVSFTSPATLYNGDELSGNLSYGILANEKVVAMGTTQAGKFEKVGVTLPEAGNYTIRVYVSNSDGISPKSEAVTRWFGNGLPIAPQNINTSYTLDDNKITISWDPVSTTLNDGYIDNSKISYTVTRTINGENPVIIADKITDNSTIDNITPSKEITLYKYTIVANHVEQVSAVAESKFVQVGVIIPPFAPNFIENPLTEGYFTTHDFLGYNDEWVYNDYAGSMYLYWVSYSNPHATNNALVTAPVKLEANKCYEISYVSFGSNGFYDELEVTTDNQNFTVLTDLAPMNPQGLSQRRAQFYPEKDGIYYFAVRVISGPAYGGNANISLFSISEGLSVYAPDEVSDVTLTPDYNGLLTLGISFTAPSKTINGNKLTSITKIDVERDGKIIKTFRNPTFGEQLSFTDRGRENADVNYTITAYNSYGAGRSWTGAAHMGVAMPVAPTNSTVSKIEDKPCSVKITWTPVAKDVYGNDINPDLIRYAIFASDYETMLMQDIPSSNPEVTLQVIKPNSGQTFAYFLVVPYTEGGINGYAGGFGVTNMVPVGTQFNTPYKESFANSKLSYPMGQETDDTEFRIAAGLSSWHLSCDSQDNDKGNIAWYTSSGHSGDLYTASVKLENYDDIALSFYYAGVPGDKAFALTPYVIYNNEKIALCDTINTEDVAQAGWNQALLSLAKYKGKTIQIGFHVYCYDNPHCFGLDNISIRRYAANDLAAGVISGPTFMNIGKNHDILVEVINEGSDDAPAGYNIQLYADGKLVDEQSGPALKPFESKMITFSHMPNPFATEQEELSSMVIWAEDEINFNNGSESIVIPVKEAKYPGVADLTASLNDAKEAELSWSEPDYAAKLIEITESFEDYDEFKYAGFGDWTVKDLDGLETYVFSYGMPGGKTPKSFFVINDENLDRINYETAHSGHKSIVSSAVSGESDDWVISPELPGIAQKVTFFAATAPEEYGEESFEFYYSTGSTDPADFIQIGDRVDVPEGEYSRDEYGDRVMVTTWYKYTYDLPAGARYFAIRCVSDDIWALLIDDITFTISEEVIALQGYNLFRNGEKINENLLTERTLKDNLAEVETGDYNYTVETVYDKGHSGLSNVETVSVDNSPVGSVEGIDAGTVKVIAANGIITILGAEGEQVYINNAAGINVYSANCESTVNVAVAPGVYLVTIASKTVKVVVK